MKAYIFLAEGFQEIEALSPLVVLRYGGVETQTVSITDDVNVTSVYNIPMKADTVIGAIDLTPEDMIILPGGLPGAYNLAECEVLNALIKSHYAAGGRVSAICAAPLVLGKLGLLKGKKATVYPGFEEHLDGAVLTDGETVVDGQIITSPGPGTAMPFAFEVFRSFVGEEKMLEVQNAMQYRLAKNEK